MKKIFVSILIAGIIANSRVFLRPDHVKPFIAKSAEPSEAISPASLRILIQRVELMSIRHGAVEIFDRTSSYDEEKNLVGNLAHSWEIRMMRENFTFKLREGISSTTAGHSPPQTLHIHSTESMDPKVSSPRTWVLEKVEGSADPMTGKSDKGRDHDQRRSYRIHKLSEASHRF
jgi:hypothetical protein